MKILHITASYKPANIYGGPIMSVAKLCEEISGISADERGFDSTQPDIQLKVYTTLANGKEELPYPNGAIKLVDGVEVQYFKRITKDHSHLSPALLWHLWKTVKHFDVVHIHAWWNLVTMPACLIAVYRGCKIVLTPRGTLSDYSFENRNNKIKAFFHQWIGKFLLNKTYFHCTSLKEVIDTQKLLNPKAIFNLPNFVELPFKYQDASSKYQVARSEKQGAGSEQQDVVLKLIFLSRVEEKKGLALLFDSLAQVDFNWNLTIVGEGELSYTESLKLKAKSLLIQEKIKWLGAIYGDEKFKLMATHDYLILPSFDENFANVVIESLFVGTPVLVTENVGLSDYVKENNLGYVCERTKPGLVDLLLNAQKAKKMNVFKRSVLNNVVLKDFEETALTTKYLNMYRSAIDN